MAELMEHSNYYCTLFNSVYLLRGYTMIQSLLAQDPKAFIYVFPFDGSAYQSLAELNIDRVSLISLKEFETEDLLRVKAERTFGEYCWTCASWTIRYCIEKFNLSSCTYVDADLYFFSNPEVLLDEAKDSSILITEHRYTSEYDQTKTSGKYCVQFIFFKNDSYGRDALNWWTEKCLEWCFARFEDGKFGDQKYLDDWETRFEKLHVLHHLGGGVAPWNVQQYETGEQNSNENIILKQIATGENFPLIFYHFHEIKLNQGSIGFKVDYVISSKIIELIHSKYYYQLSLNAELFSRKNFQSEKYISLQINFFESLMQVHLKLSQRLSISQLFCAEEETYDYSKFITLNGESSTELQSFSFFYDLSLWKKNITEFTWLPMWRSSCEILIDSIYLVKEDNVYIPLIISGGDFQRESNGTNLYRILSSHGTLRIKNISQKGIQLIIKGSWRVIPTWEANQEFNKVLNSIPYRLVISLVEIFRRIRKWIRHFRRDN